MGDSDHCLPGKAPGEPLKGSAHPVNELQPAFGSWGIRASWRGEKVECSIGGTIRPPREAIGLTWVQLAEVTVLLDGFNRQCPGKHLGRLQGAQHGTTQQRLAVAHLARGAEPLCQELCMGEATFLEPTTTPPSCDDVAQCLIGFTMADQDQSHLAERSLPGMLLFHTVAV